VHEQELGRAVLGVVRRLLRADLREVPDVDAPVARGGREDGRRVRRPRDVQDVAGVALERVQPPGGAPQVVQRDRLCGVS
jgi:hypothetical protein